MIDTLNEKKGPKTGAERQKAYRLRKADTHFEFKAWVRKENKEKVRKLMSTLA